MQALIPALISVLAAAWQEPPPAPGPIRALIEAREYARAEQILAAGLQRSPGWEAGHLLAAEMYNRTGRFDLARTSALAALRIRQSLDALLLLATASMELRRLNESIEWLEQAANRHPDHADIYRILGLDYALGGMLKESEKAFRRAVELQPANWEYHYLEGRVLYELNRHRESERELRRATELNPASVKAWTGLGQVQERFLDFDGARASYRKALDQCRAGDRDCAWPWLQLGVLDSRESAGKSAERHLRKAVELRPDWAKPHFYLGKLLLGRDDLNGARAEFEQAVHLDPAKPDYHYQLANLYRQVGLDGQAKLHFDRFREISAAERRKRAPAVLAQP